MVVAADEETSRSGRKLTRLQAQTRAIRVFNGLLVCVLGILIGMAVVATALPQRRAMEAKHAELEVVLAREAEVVAEKEDKMASLKALREDREYLELHARDRLNLHEPGEKIYRMERER